MIFYVEDDENIRELVVYTLAQSRLPARGFPDGASFFEALKTETPQLVLLDIMLPDKDGITILKRLRENETTANLPVIMATARDSEYDTIIGLDSGADDYIRKPFSLMELTARIKALLRRSGFQKSADDISDKIISAGGITVDPRAHRAAVTDELQSEFSGAETRNSRELSLTLKEFDLLYFLMQNQGVAFDRDRLLERVWGYSYGGESRTVDVHVTMLRRKLGSAAVCIETVRGLGYRFSVSPKTTEKE